MAHAIPGSAPDAGLGPVLMAVKREFEEMPGLALTAEQARRLWALESPLCSEVLGRLVESGYLRQTASGRYARPTAA